MAKLQRQTCGMSSVTVKTNDSDGHSQLLASDKDEPRSQYALFYRWFYGRLISLQLINLHQLYRQLNLEARVSLHAHGVHFHFQRLWGLFWAQGGSWSKCSLLVWLEKVADVPFNECILIPQFCELLWKTTNRDSGEMAPKKVHSTRISSIHQMAYFADYVMASACSDWHFHIVLSGEGRGCTEASTTDWKVWHLVENRSCRPAQRWVSSQTCCSCTPTAEACARPTAWLFPRHQKCNCVQSSRWENKWSP